jgi:predicted double-glycine peptidase
MKIRPLSIALAALLSAVPSLAGAEPPRREPVRSMLEQRHDMVVMQDWDLSCGAAALATLLTYQMRDPTTEEEITRVLIKREEYLANPMLVRARQGFSLLDLKRFVEGRGYVGTGLGGLEFDDLPERAPILVPVKFKTQNHFVVFRGVVGDTVYLADPAYGQRTVTRERFMRVWVDAEQLGRIGFTVREEGEENPTNRMAPRAREIGGVLDDALLQAGPFDASWR